jgi:Arc/MetJ-type ribon-helix-helix transcriptional regulator
VAAVTINTGPAYHEESLADAPRERWADILSQRRLYIETQFEYDCRCIVQYLAEAEQFHSELGYGSADEMLRKELLIRPEWVRIAVEWLTQQERPQPVTKAEADVAVVELRKRGRPKKEERENLEKGSVATFSEPGRGADYIKARLRRDRPEIAEQLERGEFKSARQAGIAAGFVKDVPTVRLNDPAKAAAAIIEKMGVEWAAQLTAALTDTLTA